MRGQRPLLLALLSLLWAGPEGLAASRARLGGTLAVGLVGVKAPGGALEEDNPESATLQSLVALPLCRLLPSATPVLATFVRAPGGAEVLVTPIAGARFQGGAVLSVRDVAEALRGPLEANSPYRSLLAPVASLEETLSTSAQHPEVPLRLRLLYPWPDLEDSLCHPAFTPRRQGLESSTQGVGLYGRDSESHYLASRDAPGGPPFPLALAFSALPARTAQRRLASGEVHTVLGEPSTSGTGALLFATYLVYRAGSLPAGALAALAAVDLEALVRTFVPGPAVAMHGLLPSGLLAAAPAPAAPRKMPAATDNVRSFSLGYEAGLPEQRAVAERLQVLLHDAGYKVRLKADARGRLLASQKAGELEATLVSVLLPPLPAPALAVVLGLTGDAGILAKELPLLGAGVDAAARAALVRERSRTLQPQLTLFPLYARGLRVQLSSVLLDARRDAFGLLVLDDAWLAR